MLCNSRSGRLLADDAKNETTIVEVNPMRQLAICLVAICALVAPDVCGAKNSEAENIAAYQQIQLTRGARDLPVLAQLEYREAIEFLQQGDRATAEQRLASAMSLDPGFADPYFTMSGLKLRDFSFDAAVYLIEGVTLASRDFHTQGRFIINFMTLVPYVLILVSLIFCIAMAIRYLPFAAHRIKEFMESRMGALLAGPAAIILLLIPFVAFPGIITALAYITITCWLFMYRRERFVLLVLITPFVLYGLFGSLLKPITSVADPSSMTSLIARANTDAGNIELIEEIEEAPAGDLEAEKEMALGLLYQRRGNYVTAADHFFRTISHEKHLAMAYINLGNVYFMQGDYAKALEGYRKSEGIEPLDAVCQHALAQAYIKELLMKESSKALQLASALGIDDTKALYTNGALETITVFPKTFSANEMWSIAMRDPGTNSKDYFDEAFSPFMRFPRTIGAWILILALVATVILAATIKSWKLTFQCSNCGNLACEGCASDTDDMSLCRECASTIEHVSSEKVIAALLRQKRQSRLVSRRRSARFATMILPGIRHFSYGRMARGFALATLFAVCAIELFSRGYVVPDERTLIFGEPPWKMIIPAFGLVLAYLSTFLSRQGMDLRDRKVRKRGPRADKKSDKKRAARAA